MKHYAPRGVSLCGARFRLTEDETQVTCKNCLRRSGQTPAPQAMTETSAAQYPITAILDDGRATRRSVHYRHGQPHVHYYQAWYAVTPRLAARDRHAPWDAARCPKCDRRKSHR